MISLRFTATAAAFAISSTASAQDTVPVSPVPAAQAPVVIQAQSRSAPTGQASLAANTEISVTVNQDVTTKGKTWAEGDMFDLSVAEDVMLGNYVVIPRGTKAVAKITFLTSKGAFGKSGKMDVEMQYLEMGGRRIPITGSFRQEGEGNTLATVGGVVAAGPFAAFITGRSGLIPKGRELTAFTAEALAVALPASAIAAPERAALAPPADLPVTATATAQVAAPVEDE